MPRPRAGSPGRQIDPLRTGVFKHLFAAVAGEMGATLQRSAFSPNIVERRDYSCALFDCEGRMIGQAAHLPVHLGSSPRSVQAALAAGPLAPGDAVLLNDPYRGGTHLPDLTLVTPVWLPGRERPSFHVANRAHHADVGGPYPGSMGPATELYAEGLRIPPVHLVRGGQVQREILDLVLANMRGTREREGDLLAQWSANRLGARRIEELCQEHGAAELEARAADQLDWTHALCKALLSELPPGRYEAHDRLELADRLGRDAHLHLVVELGGGRARFDFSGTDDQVAAPYNTPRAVVESAIFYVLRCLLPSGTPASDGVMAPVELITRPGSLVDPRPPAPVAAGNVETSQRLVDLILAALAPAAPDRIPAASAGTMSNLTFGAASGAEGGGSTWYETHAGGAGASASRAGAHAVQCHMTNTRNTPIESLERHVPARILALGLRRGSGGAGRRAGGDGLAKHLRFLEPVRVGWLADRQREGPPGAAGGGAGCPGRARARGGAAGAWTSLGAQAAVELPAGGEVLLETPGGGGHG
ncbi:hydantoinase B/oxoprolinase family protein [Engelhardtia mirabilis]|uniref:Acetophenone carboxylase delta subunit n=1 Tax=Engelhardtia mirabilis TaxID=2528011 RepID=A0A518BPU9_9BACT|nr:Acetophenone carboxylase delta subunit [Planctomycetes bacterium Pla133]QDV03327.1 Acetophenone carboxylase delta subunit [Planctomycetes bacterium Pla86]